MTTGVSTQAPIAAELSPSERFTAKVVQEFTANNGGLQLTRYQSKLIQAYYIKLDSILKINEGKRMAKSEQYREAIAYTWNNVNMNKLSQDIVAWAGIGLDPLQKNHINLITYANNKTSQYDIGFIIGYRGAELKAKKYGFDCPDNVVVEVVFANDRFKPFKRDRNNKTENYEFEMAENAFQRGDIVGGFYFHEYTDRPEKNVIEVFSLKDIEKRKPKSASAEFWGGTKMVKKWIQDPNDANKKKQVEEPEVIEGWFEEMVYKTLFLAAYNDITIDSEKIDEHLVKVMQLEEEVSPAADAPASVSATVNTQIQQNGNKTAFNFEDAQVINDQDPETDQAPGNKFQVPPEDGKLDTMAKVGQENAAKEAAAVTEPKKTADAGVQPAFGFPKQ